MAATPDHLGREVKPVEWITAYPAEIAYRVLDFLPTQDVLRVRLANRATRDLVTGYQPLRNSTHEFSGRVHDNSGRVHDKPTRTDFIRRFDFLTSMGAEPMRIPVICWLPACFKELPIISNRCYSVRLMGASKGYHKVHAAPWDFMEKISGLLRNMHQLQSLQIESIRLSPANCATLYEIPVVKRLRVLRFVNCEITGEMPANFATLTALETFDASRNTGLRSWMTFGPSPQQIGSPQMSFPNLRSLILAKNSLNCLPESIAAVAPQLETLDVSFNCHLVLPRSIGQLSRLRVLKLTKIEGMGQLPDSIYDLKSLEELHAANIGLISVPEHIGALQHLRILDLSLNQLTTLPASISNLRNLEELTVTHNARRIRIDASVSALPRLTQLWY